MSERLKQFYREYLAWVEAGCRDHRSFSTRYGLCTALEDWSNFDSDLCEEQAALFRAAGLEYSYPFDHDDFMYGIERDKTLNPKRIAFVREHAA